MDEKHRKRPRDFNQAAKLVIEIATGQAENGRGATRQRKSQPARAKPSKRPKRAK